MTPLRHLAGFFRRIGALLGLAFAAAPGRAAAAVAAELLGAALGLVSSTRIQGVVQAAAGKDARLAVTEGLILAGAAGGAGLAYLVYGRLAPRVVEAVAAHLDGELVRLTARMPTLAYADQPAHADKIALVRGSSQQLARGLQAIALNLRIAVTLIGVFVILAGVDRWLILLPLFAVPRALAGREARRLTVRAQEANAEPMRLRSQIFTLATSAAAGKELRVFGLGPELIDRYRQITRATRRLNLEMNWGGALWSAAGDMVFTLGCVGAVAWLAVRAAAGAVTPGGVALAATLATGLILQMSMALQFAQFLQAITTTAERYLWLVDASDAAVKAASGRIRPPARLARGIRLEEVSFTYEGHERPVLAGLSADLPAGKVIALVGENGSGKSTLVKLLCGFYPPSAGQILIDGVDLSELDLAAWRARVGAAFQDYANFELVLHESVGVGRLERLGERPLAAAALARAGAADPRALAPEGLEAMLGRRWGGAELSGGQWQKIALARGLMREDALLMVFDEPAAALDPGAEHDLFQRFAASARGAAAGGRTTLLISHRFSTVRMADLILVLDGGRLLETGDHEALMAAGGRYAELFELQASAYR